MSESGLSVRLGHLLSMIRFSHTVFALPFALLAAVMAWTTPTRGGAPPLFRWIDLLAILVCMVSARSAAMAFNRLVDRHVDARNPRTAGRHLPAGILSTRSVAWFTVACCGVFVAATALFLPNRLPLMLSLPVLLILLLYSYTKRFTALAHFWLGVSLMLAPLGAWIALRGELLLVDGCEWIPPTLLGLAVLFWVAGFDIIYSCQDYQFDRQARLHSIPAWVGPHRALRLAAWCHAAMVLVLYLLPWLSGMVGVPLGLGPIYYVGVTAVAALLLYEHWLVRPDDLTRVNAAFFHVNAVVSFGLFLVASVDLLW